MSAMDQATTDRAQAADAVTTEVIRYGLEAAADYMRVTLCRTAVSPVIYEMQDFAAALFDRDMRLLAQARSMPGFLGTLGFAVEAMVGRVGGPEALREGDVIFSTYGYDIGAHQQDATIVVPGFFAGELIGYAAVKAHQLDIGAKDPYCTDTIDIFQEGAIFPGVRIYAGGVQNEDLYRTILANSRAPKALEGDLRAQIGCAQVGLRELNRLLERFGRERFDGAVERIFDHGERVMRTFVSGLADGTYRASGAMDDDCISVGVPVPLEVRVEVAGDGIVVDLTESADQQAGPINSPRAMTVSQTLLAVITLAGAGRSMNEGYFRPIEVKTRPGSVFEPIAPAPIFLYGLPGTFAFSLVHQALSPALPGVVPADNGGHGAAMLWGVDEGGMWIATLCHAVGMGASARGDMTVPLMPPPVSGLLSSPAEIVELSGHVVVEQQELAQDSAGAGRFRGGLAVDARYRTRDGQKLISLQDRTKSPPWGLEGGGPARANSSRVRFPDGTVQELTKVTSLPLPAGTAMEYQSAGGGGWGDPAERDPQAVLDDIREGYVSEAAARRDYPHAFGDAGGE